MGGCPSTKSTGPSAQVAGPVPDRGCMTLCSFEGHSSSCQGHIQWTADTWFKGKHDACIQSYEVIAKRCPMCNQVCPLEATKCVTHAASPTQPSKPFDCMAGLTNWMTGWSVAKKAWCCKNEDRGCPVAVNQ